MASPTPSPTNIWYIQDEFGTAGGASGMPMSPDFIASSTANATQVAYLFATLFQSSVRLVQKFSSNSGAWGTNTGFTSTLVSPGPANTALTVVPSGVLLAGVAP